MAAKVFSDAGGNWSDNAAWVGDSPAGAGDTVTATETSGNITIDTPSACTSIILTGYVGILTFNATLTVGGTVTFVSGMGTIAGTSDLICTVTATLTSGGKVLSGGLQFGGSSQTYTMADDWAVTGVLTLSGTTAITINATAKTITVAGGVTVTTNTSGTAKLKMTGGSWTGGGILKNSLELAGDITLLNGTLYYNTGTLLYTSGTITVTGNTISCALATVFTGSFHMNNLTISASVSIYIPNPFYVDGTLLLSAGGASFSNNGCTMILGALTLSGAGGNVNFPGNVTVAGAITIGCGVLFYVLSNAYTVQAASFTVTAAVTIQLREAPWIITGTITLGANTVLNSGGAVGGVISAAGLVCSTYNVSGTLVITLTGGTWSGTGTFISQVKFAGNVTISSGTRNCRSLYYISGTITVTGVTLSIDATATLDTNPLVWENVILTGTTAITLILNSLLSISGTFTLCNANVTFAGTAGFTVGTLTNTTITATRTLTFVNGKTYTITAAFTTVHAAAQTVRFTLTSDHASIKAIIILGPGATQNIGFVDPTRIDSSPGQQIFSYKGTINTCLNWILAYPVNIALNDPQLCIGI